ncbi:MAG: DUF3365 domain-containing protein [Burkholderiales bacterium]|nr:DUF3365 domain-containing protein [Burkholderiales bacterium]
MRKYAIVTLFAAAIPAYAADPAWIPDARQVASSVPPRLLAVLTEEIGKSGPEGAIAVCSEKAPAMAKAASEATGWNIRRVSLRNRNPKAVPDAWERAALEEFDRRAAAGESPATLEKFAVVQENGRDVYRYMKALPVQELCVSCHGPANRLSPAVKAELLKRYPDDKGTGYTPGQIRGAMTIKKPA